MSIVKGILYKYWKSFKDHDGTVIFDKICKNWEKKTKPPLKKSYYISFLRCVKWILFFLIGTIHIKEITIRFDFP